MNLPSLLLWRIEFLFLISIPPFLDSEKPKYVFTEQKAVVGSPSTMQAIPINLSTPDITV